jgi:ketosteroid isomerase-like protein
MTAIPTDGDLAKIRAVRDAFIAADGACDAVAMTGLLADDIVILHPFCGVFDGHEAASRFMREVLGEIAAQFEKRVSYSTIELKLAGDLAFERGTIAQELVPRDGGVTEYDSGQYLWLYAKGPDGVWKVARIAGALVGHLEEERGES